MAIGRWIKGLNDCQASSNDRFLENSKDCDYDTFFPSLKQKITPANYSGESVFVSWE